MSEILESFGEVLLTLLPASDYGKVIWLIVFCIFALILTGRLKLEWIGKSVRYMWSRFIRCPLGHHSWRISGIGFVDLHTGGGIEGVHKCKYCGKQDYFEGI